MHLICSAIVGDDDADDDGDDQYDIPNLGDGSQS